jgi:hypothetical protein
MGAHIGMVPVHPPFLHSTFSRQSSRMSSPYSQAALPVQADPMVGALAGQPGVGAPLHVPSVMIGGQFAKQPHTSPPLHVAPDPQSASLQQEPGAGGFTHTVSTHSIPPGHSCVVGSQHV